MEEFVALDWICAVLVWKMIGFRLRVYSFENGSLAQYQKGVKALLALRLYSDVSL